MGARARRSVEPCDSDLVEVDATLFPMTGRIKKILTDKGFGFIQPDDGSDDVFFHRSKLGAKTQFEDLREGDEVQFQVRPGDKGPQAFDLRVR